MKVEFNTTQFVFSHGKEPRGYGSWAFEFDDKRGVWFAPSSTYAKAKKSAAREANIRAAGSNCHHTTIKVCP